MGRIARIVIPGLPHHVTQRGNRKADVFLSDEDMEMYLSLLGKYAQKYSLDILGYCLMTNHIHLVAIPHKQDTLGNTLRDTHTAYAQRFNKRDKTTGHLWQGRYFSCVLDDAHFFRALRYVETNPVRAGLVPYAEQYRWSSAGWHCGLREDALLKMPMEYRSTIGNWQQWLSERDEDSAEYMRRQTSSGRPCGSPSFIDQLESLLGRALRPLKRGPKPKQNDKKEEFRSLSPK